MHFCSDAIDSMKKMKYRCVVVFKLSQNYTCGGVQAVSQLRMLLGRILLSPGQLGAFFFDHPFFSFF
jgi:hypothetical protein